MSSITNFLNIAKKKRLKQKDVTEKKIEDDYCSYAKNNKCAALKLIYLNKRGFPDRTTLVPGGVIFFIEFKSKGKKQTPTQTLAQKLIESFGFKYYICDEIGQAEAILDGYLK